MILTSPFRLVVDLNVWTKDFQADVTRQRLTDPQSIVNAVMDGRGSFGPIELVMSHTMLSRLEQVLARIIAEAKERREPDKASPRVLALARRSPESLVRYIDNIVAAMAIGPYMVLGGGVFPSRETFHELRTDRSPNRLQWPDPEDGRVIDTAVASKAHAIVTENFKDYSSYDDTILDKGRVHIRHTAGHDLLIVDQERMAGFIQRGFPKDLEQTIVKIVEQTSITSPAENLLTGEIGTRGE